MLINNLGSLKAELARYMFHKRFAPDYDTAIQNFEAVCNRRLRVRQMETAATLRPGTLPADYLDWRTVLWIGKTPLVEIEYVHPAYFRTTWIELDHGDPKIFRIEGNTFSVKPDPVAPNDLFQFHYYQKIPTILNVPAGDNASNWLINDHPDLYLFGTVFELFVLGRNAEAGSAYKQMRDEKMSELIQLSSLSTGATSSLVRGEGSAIGSGGEYF